MRVCLVLSIKKSNGEGGFANFAPAKKLVKMRYVTHVSINSASGLVASNCFRANSVYDPDQTGVGHQPAYYDQCAAIWNHYRVVSSRIKASFVNNGSEATIAATVGIKLDDEGTISAVLSDLLEQDSLVESRILRLSATDDFAVVSNSYSESKFFGTRTPDTTALFGANPTEGAFFNVFVCPTDETTEIGPILVQVEIDYDVECAELKDLVPSDARITNLRAKSAAKQTSRVPPTYKPL